MGGILLIDDTADTLETFGMLLTADGAVVTMAQSGGQALERADAAEFDLIVSDSACRS